MKENDKEIENLIEKMMAENTLESPSADFTSNLMSHILVAEKAKIKPYKPLISISTWIFIGIALAVLALYNAIASKAGAANFFISTHHCKLNLGSTMASVLSLNPTWFT